MGIVESPVASDAEEAVGHIAAVRGRVTIVRAGLHLVAQVGDAVFPGDSVRSGATAVVGLSLIDGSGVSLGENTHSVLDEVIYDPESQTGRLVLSVLQGTLVFDGGAISDWKQDAVLIRTPAAGIEIFSSLVGVSIDNAGALRVALLDLGDAADGNVMISNDQGDVRLRRSLSESFVYGPRDAPNAAHLVSWADAMTVFRNPVDLLETYDRSPIAFAPPSEAPADSAPERPASSLPDVETAGGAHDDREPYDEPRIRVATGDPSGGEEDAPARQILADIATSTFEFAKIENSAERGSTPIEAGRGAAAEPNAAPATTGLIVTGAEDQAVVGRLTAEDPDNDRLTFVLAPDGGPSHGTVQLNADGTYSYRPDANFSGSDSFAYLVDDGKGGTSTATVEVTIAPVADTPDLTVADVVGAEDTAIALSVSARLTDASEQLAMRVSGVPAGAMLSAGTDNGDGSWTLAPGELAGLTITPAAHYSGSFNLSYEAISSVPLTGESASISDTAMIVVNPVADVPFLGVAPATGIEDISVPLTIVASTVDPSETVRIEISGLPAGATLNAGVDTGSGIWVLDARDLTDLRLLLPHDFADSFRLSVSAISSDGVSAAAAIAVIDVAMTSTGDVSLGVNHVARPETDSAVTLPLDLHPAVGDIDASEVLTDVVVTFDQDLPAGAVVSGGTLNGRIMTIPAASVASASITVPPDWAGEITGSAVAHTNEGESAPAIVSLSAVAVPDVPSLSMTIVPDEAANAAARGGFVSVWEDPNLDGSSAAIMAQRFDAAGNRFGAEFRVNTTAAAAQVNPSATTLAHGGFVVVWDSNNQDGSNYGVYLQRYDANGNPDGMETRVNVFTTGNQQTCQVAALEGGGFVVAWAGRGSDDTQGIFARQFDAAGQPVASEFRLNSTVSGTQSIPSVAALEGGGFVALWEGTGTGDTAGVFGRRYDAAGTPIGSEFRANTTTAQAQDLADVTALDGGGFVAVWHGRGTGDTNGIFMRTYGADGQPVGGETRVNTTTTGTQTHSSAETLADGSFIVTWNGRGADDTNGIYAQRFDASGARLGGEFRINSTTSNTQDYPTISPLVDGGFVVNWESSGQDGSVQGIFARRFDATGAPTSAEFQVNTTIQGAQVDPASSGLNTGVQYFDFTIAAAFGDSADTSERHQVRIDVPDGFALVTDPSTWTDLPSGVSAALVGGDVMLTAATGSDGIESFSYSFPIVQNDLTVDTASFSAEAQSTEIATGEVATTAVQTALALGTPGDDAISGSDGAEAIYSGTGEDTIAGGGGSDSIYGGEDNDVISGDAGNDELFGGEGDDTLAGGDGDDTIAGGAGDDAMSGGEGNDTFAIVPENEAGATDNIADFSLGDELRISGISADLDDLSFVQVGDDTVVQIGGYDVDITLENVQADQMVSYQLTPDPQSDLIVVFADDAVHRGTG